MNNKYRLVQDGYGGYEIIACSSGLCEIDKVVCEVGDKNNAEIIFNALINASQSEAQQAQPTSTPDWTAIQTAVGGDCPISIVAALGNNECTWEEAADRICAYATAAFNNALQSPTNTVSAQDDWKDAVRTAIQELYLAMWKSYESGNRITSMDIDLVHKHVGLLSLGGCLDAAISSMKAKGE